MHFEGSFEVKAPRQRVWNFLLDPKVLAKALPDLEKMDVKGEDKFDARFKVGISHIKGSVGFSFAITEKTPLTHAKLVGHGLGVGSSIDLETSFDLSDSPSGGTVVKWTADAKVGGLLAGIGSRLLAPTTEKKVNQLIEVLKKELAR